MATKKKTKSSDVEEVTAPTKPYMITFKLKSVSPYSQSQALRTDRGPNETAASHDSRCWRERMHVDEDGYVTLSAMGLKHALVEASRYDDVKIAGRGNQKYAKKVAAACWISTNPKLRIKAEDVPYEDLFVPADGQPGSGKRVWRRFPKIENWDAEVTVDVLDPIVTPALLTQLMKTAGNLVGIGRFRPSSRSAGYYGRFTVEGVSVI